jgi:phosphoribosylamine--glycine ligase
MLYWMRKNVMSPSLKVLVVGSGGREHALAWKLAQSPRAAEVIVAPGNPGTAAEPGCRNVDVAMDDIDGLLRLALAENVGLTVVGPEVPLSFGIVDRFRAAGLRIFGPTREAAQLESSKAFAKAFLARHAIPTAAYEVFTDLQAALDYIARRGAPIVVKADGLAAGKGVVVASTVAEAQDAVRDMLGGSLVGAAGARVVIEDFLDGEEASYIVVAAGREYVAMPSSQDHKRIFDGDQGPNTGGMGAYSPAPVVTPEVEARIQREVIEPTLAGMIAENRPFTGFLYAGVMIDRTGHVRVLEFNTRMGDPETQPLLFRLESDLLDLLEAALDGELSAASPKWSAEPAMAVVLAAAGYPARARLGDAISSHPPVAPGSKVFHAGTAVRNGVLVTAGGRVLCVVGRGSDLFGARQAAYDAVAGIRFDGMQFRSDIGEKALRRGTS